jgi:hypothetical protein
VNCVPRTGPRLVAKRKRKETAELTEAVEAADIADIADTAANASKKRKGRHNKIAEASEEVEEAEDATVQQLTAKQATADHSADADVIHDGNEDASDPTLQQ